MCKKVSRNRVSENLQMQLDKLVRHNRQGSFKTKERYHEAMQRFCDFVWLRFKLQKLANISEKHITAYVEDMQERKLAAGTIKTNLSAIRFWHDKIQDARYEIPPNSELDLERRSFGKTDRAWTDAEYKRMIKFCGKKDRDDHAGVFTLARYAALRIHECFRIDTATAGRALKTGELIIKGKNGKLRTVPIDENIKIVLRKKLSITKRGSKLFVPDDTKTHRAIKLVQQFICDHRGHLKDRDSKRSFTFHGLRHLCAAEWYVMFKDMGYDEFRTCKQVSRWLGHERDEVTRIYLASTPRMKAESPID